MEAVKNEMKKPVIKVDYLFHRDQPCLAVRFPFNEGLNTEIKKIPQASFSRTNKCWCIPQRENLLNDIFETFRGKAFVDYSSLQGQKKESEAEKEPKKNIIRKEEEIKKILRIMEQKLNLKGYAESTAKTYTEQFKQFLQFYSPAVPTDLSEIEIRNYLLYLIEKKKLSRSTQNQAINAIKFFYEKVLNQDRKVYYLERPFKDKLLPSVMSEEEVLDLFNVAMNSKHRLMLMIIYSAGLRRSELLNLRKGDIDLKRGTILIKGGKGRKDRQSILAKTLVAPIEAYLTEHKPTHWLFEGMGQKQYSATSLQSIFSRAVKIAGITKEVHLHTLRHSFATHLLEGGTSTRYIQELLGHESSKTTEIYTQVTQFALEKIKSPLDTIAQQRKIEKGKD